MNKVSKTMRKGFTLLELMVVMAIMSVLLLAVMSMTTPVSRMFRRTNVSENVYAAGDNITNYLQRTLQYADNVWVFDGNEPEATNLSSTASAFKNTYYKHIVVGTGVADATSCKFVDGKVHILQLSNSDGKIYKYDYSFKAQNDVVTQDGAKTEALNPAYFNNDYQDYNFRYAIGASKLEAATKSGNKLMDGTEFIFNLKSEIDGAKIEGGFDRFALTIVANSGKKPEKKDGAYQFVGPCTSSVTSIPFTNISIRKGDTCNRLFIPDNTITSNIHSQKELPAYNPKYVSGSGTTYTNQSFINLALDNEISFDKDIYFVYSYADELK